MTTSYLPLSRTLVLRMDPADSVEFFKLSGGILGGAFGVRFFDWATARWRKKQREPVELTAKIIDDGDRLREMLLEEVKSLRVEKDTVRERAHHAEILLATANADNVALRNRLERKDEQNKALQTQIVNLGHQPVFYTGPSGRSDTPAVASVTTTTVTTVAEEVKAP